MRANALLASVHRSTRVVYVLPLPTPYEKKNKIDIVRISHVPSAAAISQHRQSPDLINLQSIPSKRQATNSPSARQNERVAVNTHQITSPDCEEH